MLILGIDPGTAITGYGLIKTRPSKRSGLKRDNGFGYVSHGTLNTSKDDLMPHRLFSLQEQLEKIIKDNQPDCLVLEQLFFGMNSKTAILVGQARGVIMATAAAFDLPLFEYQGLAVKKLLTGFGHAKKKDIQKTVKKILNLKEIPRPDDAADALAMAIYHVLKTKI